MYSKVLEIVNNKMLNINEKAPYCNWHKAFWGGGWSKYTRYTDFDPACEQVQ